MADDNVVEFGGITRHDIDPDKLLENAKGNFNTVLVLGLNHEGKLDLRTSTGDMSTVVTLLDLAGHQVLEDLLAEMRDG